MEVCVCMYHMYVLYVCMCFKAGCDKCLYIPLFAYLYSIWHVKLCNIVCIVRSNSKEVYVYDMMTVCRRHVSTGDATAHGSA